MLDHRLNEEPCPVSESLLGDLYRADPEGLSALIETVPPYVRAVLAVYCRRRGHLAGIGLSLAASCEKEDLIIAGGDFGAMLFEQARRAPEIEERRPKISLAREPFRKLVAQDLI
ncbi:MAG TPA: hypothetical protein VFT69_09120 [Pseudolabrys sp.]|jgi:hypothetical protein|nr:hypothetical protein [Pseudolabrys sp.]